MKNKIQILHVDDNPLDRQLVKDALCKENDAFEIIEADSREKFERHLDEQDFDLILSDFNILGFDGLQVLQIVHDKNPEIPVIIVTGTGSEEVAIQAMKIGASDYVIKSVKHIRGLAHTIEKVLVNKKNQDERNEAIAKLKKSEEKYRRLFENMQDVYYQIDNQDIIREISPSIFKLAEYKREELIGTTVASFYYDIQEREDMLSILSQKGVVWDFEVRLKAKSGQVKYASLNAHYMVDENNKQIGIEGSLRDIDKRKHFEEELIAAKEKAEESDNLKTSFLHNISHEIRTPLNAIVGFSAILTDPNLPLEKRKGFSDIIVKSSDLLLSIISDIINISTIEAGQEKLSLVSTDINSKFKLLYEQFSPRAKEKNIKFHFNTTLSDSDSVTLLDETKFLQILTNLLDNAFKYTQHGAVSFGYYLKENYLEFYVEDTGIGIPAELHESVFERFRQVETTATRQYGGSGLGLSLSKAYVEMLGG
ncbi:MAG: response regulator, partial [Bacteroidales bacterium]|nr:response regulator [Bacteroidales bacterium]